jgi:hypothetical protein
MNLPYFWLEFHNLPLLEMTPSPKFAGDQDEDEHPQLAVAIKQIIFNGCTHAKIQFLP